MSEKSALPGSGKEPGKMKTIGELFSRLSEQMTSLVKGEIQLTKLKAMNAAKKLGGGIALLAAAAVLALFLFGVLLHAAIMGLAVVMPEWAAALVVAAVLLVIVIICALLGRSQLLKAKADQPDPKADINKAVEAAKTGFKRGLATAEENAMPVDTEVTIVSAPTVQTTQKGA